MALECICRATIPTRIPGGVNLWQVCQDEMSSSWNEIDGTDLTEPQERDLRSLFHSYIRTAVASERFVELWKPQMAIISSIADPISYAHVMQLRLAGVDVAVCRYDVDDDVIVVESPF